ncbi:MAG: ComEC/Rec2 family competence protein [Hyphomicrobium sp.]
MTWRAARDGERRSIGDASAGDWPSDHALRPQALWRVRAALDAERGRFFLWSPVCFGVGIAAYFALPREPHLAAALTPLAIALVLKFAAGRGTLAAAAVTGALLACAGFAVAKVRVDRVAAPVLSKQIRNVDVSGVVLRAEQRGVRGQRLTIAVEALGDLPPQARPVRVRIRTMIDGARASPGDKIRIKATLGPPAKPALPGAFDYARTAWFEQLGGVGYAFAKPVVATRAQPSQLSERFWQWIEDLRTEIAARVKEALPGETGAIATALITGERGGISAETNEAFKDSGLFHILSISGLHMVIMAGAVFYLLRLMLAAVPAAALRLPIKKIAAAAGILAALAYLALSGAAFATVRATAMITVMFVAVLLDRPALAMRNVALSALAILAIYPESLLDAGFQMSFAAVTALVAAYEGVNRAWRRREAGHPAWRIAAFFGGIVASTLIASIAVAPFAAYHFHQSQQYAVIANLIAIPICNLVVMPAALMALLLMPFGLEHVALWPMGQGIEAMSWCARAVGALPGAVGAIPAIPTLSFALMACGGMWLALWRTRQRALGLAAIAAGLAIAPMKDRPDVLIARSGALVAMRLPDGRLSALPARQSAFELQRWLEHDGDGRKAREAQRGEGFTCDGVSCVADVKGVRLAVPRHAAALVDDCARAELLVLSTPRPKGCEGPAEIIDLFGIWRAGGYAIYVEPSAATERPKLRIETVAALRGERPWSETLAPRRQPADARALPKPRLTSPTDSVGVDGRALSPEADAATVEPRPEIEDDYADKDFTEDAPPP